MPSFQEDRERERERDREKFLFSAQIPQTFWPVLAMPLSEHMPQPPCLLPSEGTHLGAHCCHHLLSGNTATRAGHAIAASSQVWGRDTNVHVVQELVMAAFGTNIENISVTAWREWKTKEEKQSKTETQFWNTKFSKYGDVVVNDVIISSMQTCDHPGVNQAGSHEKHHYEYHEKWGRSVPTVKLAWHFPLYKSDSSCPYLFQPLSIADEMSHDNCPPQAGLSCTSSEKKKKERERIHIFLKTSIKQKEFGLPTLKQIS